MMYDDDALDRALAALPLEEPPATLHARIMSATVFRTRPAIQAWEIWLVSTLVAVAAWLTWAALTAPNAAERLSDALDRVVTTTGITSEVTVLWVLVGVSAAWWISQLTFPTRRSIRIR